MKQNYACRGPLRDKTPLRKSSKAKPKRVCFGDKHKVLRVRATSMEDDVKQILGMCRCCAASPVGGCYKDLFHKYPSSMSDDEGTELYADMLDQCFDISISQLSEGPGGPNNLICEFCIARLLDANQFKKQVLISERKFVNMMLLRGEIQNKVVSNETDPIITHEDVKDEEPEDLQGAAREDISDEAEGLSGSCFEEPSGSEELSSARRRRAVTLSPDGLSPARGAESDSSSRVFRCRLEVRDARHELQCSQCGAWSLTAARLQQHRQTHATGHQPTHVGQGHTHTQHNANIFVCDICDKTFPRKDSLKRHMFVHNRIKPFSCNICSKAYTRNSDLKIHIEHIHSGVKPLYTCNICSKSFIWACSLKEHLRIHSNKRPFACDICYKKFTRNHDLKIHLRIHSGDKPYSCHICRKNFTRNGHLKDHIWRIHIHSR